ncbi:MAG: NFACT family protein [Firmicutes bacterium]|nr:NFACT family protein [Bacillota bacterium]
MPNDALHIKFAAREQHNALSGGRIDKITSVSFDTICLRVFNNGATHNLLLSANAEKPRCYITAAIPQGLSAAPAFLTHLKKHIGGGRIKSIETEKGERIIKIGIEAKNEFGEARFFTLIAEIMGRHSNILLTNDVGRITESMKHIPPDLSSKRPVLPGLLYETAPRSAEKLCAETQNGLLAERFTQFGGGDLADFLLKNLSGLSPVSIAEAAHGAAGSADIGKAAAAEIARLYSESAFSPCIEKMEGRIADFFVRPFGSRGGEFISMPSLNAAMDAFYTENAARAAFDAQSRKLVSAAKTAHSRAEKRLGLLMQQKSAADDFETERIKGEILTANLYRAKQGDLFLEAENYYESPCVPITIELCLKLSPAAVAQRYYKRYQKKKKTLAYTVPQIEQAKQDAEYFESVLVSVKACETLDDLAEIAEELIKNGALKAEKTSANKKQAAVQSRAAGVKRTEFEGYVILTGKNNTQNDALVKGSQPCDVWLHVKDGAGAHTVIVNPKKSMPPEKILRRAAAITALYSKASAGENIAVDYTFIKFVFKQKGAPPGKVVYKEQKTVYVTP